MSRLPFVWDDDIDELTFRADAQDAGLTERHACSRSSRLAFGVSWPWPIAGVGLSAIPPDRVVAHTSAVLRHGKES
jgi:hypothetical protein